MSTARDYTPGHLRCPVVGPCPHTRKPDADPARCSLCLHPEPQPRVAPPRLYADRLVGPEVEEYDGGSLNVTLRNENIRSPKPRKAKVQP